MNTGQPVIERSAARTAWEETGTVLVPDALEPARFEELVKEAHDRIGLATPHVRDEMSAHRDGSFAAPFHCAFVPAGPVLEALAYDRTLWAAVREATGLPRLVPRGGAVVVYRKGDFQGVHFDSVRASVTIGVALTEGLPPMGWAPHLRDAHPDALALLCADQGLFPEGDAFQTLNHEFGSGSLRAFAGYNIPHWRPPYPGELGLLATFSYLDL
ncbi:hypothetical protein [Streptomyces sp. cg36]|uniref:hypothetical protein n=1 Tax=Streptomyces sp. cg36 TaxID=3238798 RepID=UPI0034E2F42B